MKRYDKLGGVIALGVSVGLALALVVHEQRLTELDRLEDPAPAGAVGMQVATAAAPQG